MKRMLALVSVVTVLAFALDTWADCGNCAAKTATAACAAGGCGGAQCAAGACCAAQCETTKSCPIAAAMERLPKLTYAVGEKAVGCPKEAAELAKAQNSQVHYCVLEKKFESESDAQTALLDATEKFVADFATPHKCSTSGQLTLAGQAQSCEQKAAQTAELMKAAMDKVTLAYAVGEKECGCPVEAKKLASESGKEMLFVVGTEKTGCEKTARLTLARAKYKAAVEALVKAQSVAGQPAVTAGT